MTVARAPGGPTDQEPGWPDTGPGSRPLGLLAAPNGATHDQLITQLTALQARATTMPEIEQAKGALMLAHGLSADAAFDLLRSYSQDRNIKIRDIAARLTEQLATPGRSAAAARHVDHLLDSVTTGTQDPAPARAATLPTQPATPPDMTRPPSRQVHRRGRSHPDAPPERPGPPRRSDPTTIDRHAL